MTMDRATELRTAFDRAFAEAPRGPRMETLDLLRIQLGGESHVVALSEVAALHVDQHVCPVPTPATELLGVMAVRAAIIPVFDLRAILGIRSDAPPRWCILAREIGSAFAFDGFAGMLRVSSGPVASAEPGFVRGVVLHEGRSYPLISLTAVASFLDERWAKER